MYYPKKSKITLIAEQARNFHLENSFDDGMYSILSLDNTSDDCRL